VTTDAPYSLVRLARGAWSVRSRAHAETFHPVVGPAEEARTLYAGQLDLPKRVREEPDDFVIWDIGLGAAANALAAIEACASIPGRTCLYSFDCTLEPLAFALTHAEDLSYLRGYEVLLQRLMASGEVNWTAGTREIAWLLVLGDYPDWLRQRQLALEPRLEPDTETGHQTPVVGPEDGAGLLTSRLPTPASAGGASVLASRLGPRTLESSAAREYARPTDRDVSSGTAQQGRLALPFEGLSSGPAREYARPTDREVPSPQPGFMAPADLQPLVPAPHAILFDPFSPAKNPAMWSLELFRDLYRALDPRRPCALATYSRSTMLRVTLLLAGFYVGAGEATGEKEETTLAANARTLLRHPLDRKWLRRAQQSTSAEPLRGNHYRQARLSADSWERLLQHPQFSH
jgi:hypothetical protein